MPSPYQTFSFEWLVSPERPASTFRPEHSDVEWLPFPIPPETGEGGFQKVELALDMSVFRGVHRFTPAAVGQLIPLANVTIDLPGPTLMVQIMRGGQVFHRERYPACELLMLPGHDLFRLTDRVDLTPILDGSHNSEMTCLTVGLGTLSELIGLDVADRLLRAVGLSSCPQVVIKAMPLQVSAHLHGAIGSSMKGPARMLSCQARSLDYLAALVDFALGQQATPDGGSAAARRRARSVHDLLTATDGKLPTLDELARQYGCSARRLNDDFVAEFGKSIFAFVTAHRLDEAHAAILHTEVPLKALAERLGYAHFNHFSVAFKKKFGYPPGSLRRTRKEQAGPG